MLKKQIIKKVFDDKFNINGMRSQILLENERKDKKKVNKIYRFAIPVCLVAVLGVILFSNYNNFILKSNNIKNSIYVNELESLIHGEKVFEVEEVDIENIPEKFDFMFHINIPKSFSLERKYNLYTRSNIEVNKFDVLRDYVFEYKNSNGEKIIISFSEIGKPLKDYDIVESNLSKINNTNMFILQYQDMFIITFKYQNIYFNIEATNINIDELTLLLNSIVK